MNRTNSASSRPSSTGSAHSVRNAGSNRDRGPNRKQDICIGEEVRIAICLAVERFRVDDSQKGIYFSICPIFVTPELLDMIIVT